MEKQKFTILTYIGCGTILAFGFATSGFFIGKSIERFKEMDRSVTVKGLSERIVESDFAELTITFKQVGDELPEIYEKMNEDKEYIIDFLKTQGLDKGEIKTGVIETTDKKAKEFYENKKDSYRYILKNSITVKSKNISALNKILSNINDLIKHNIAVSTAISYRYTKFDVLRNEMLEEATKSARKAAEQFATDSNSKVGEIKSAHQGAFTITSADANNDYDYKEEKSFEKKIRVVSTITFSLDKS